jgi:hypothetical protein
MRPDTILEAAVINGQPLLDAETANREVIRLTVENIRLQARIELWTDGIKREGK